MQTYALNLTNGSSRSFSTAGDLFVYESGQVAGQEAGDARIIVKPDSGGEITLRAGQQFRLPKGESASQWFVRPAVDGAPVVGSIIIGAGEFHDANTLNTFKLDGTFTNAVKVTNTTAEPVPVAMDQKSMQERPVMTYNTIKKVDLAGGLPIPVITAAQNANGVIIESVFVRSVQQQVELLVGGAVVMAKLFDTPNTTRIKVMPGHAIEARMLGSGSTATLDALLTVL